MLDSLVLLAYLVLLVCVCGLVAFVSLLLGVLVAGVCVGSLVVCYCIGFGVFDVYYFGVLSV